MANHPEIRDYGDEPFIFNISHATCMNQNFRTTLWTGQNMQLTLMSIPPMGDIGVEIHTDVDQFIRVESGRARVFIGNCREALNRSVEVSAGYAIIIPAGTWHNVVNTAPCPLKLYSLYAPPKHPFGTVNRTKWDASHSEHLTQ